MGFLIELLRPILVPIATEVFVRLMDRWMSDPQWRFDQMQAIEKWQSAKTDEEKRDAAKRLRDLARS